MLSPNFQVANFEVEEFNVEPISISYKFKGTEKAITKELFKVGSNFPSTKSITFDNKSGKVDLMVHYSEGSTLMTGLPNQISQYDIGEHKIDEKTEKFAFTMRVSNNIHNVAALDEVELVQEWTEMEKIPVKGSATVVPPPKKEEEGDKAAEKEEPKPEVTKPEQKFETKEKKKKTFSNIKFTSSSFALAPNQRQEFFDLENTLCMEDDDILE